jgi:hypothetical protein
VSVVVVNRALGWGAGGRLAKAMLVMLMRRASRKPQLGKWWMIDMMFDIMDSELKTGKRIAGLKSRPY